MSINELEEIPSCPICKKDMVLKNGMYGEFWGCSKYPKCKGHRNIIKHSSKFNKLEVLNIIYDDVIKNGDIKSILNECKNTSKKVEEIIDECGSVEQCLTDNNICYKVLEYLHSENRYIDTSKIIYAIYLVRGEVTSNFKFWINSIDYTNKYMEKDIKKAIIENWDRTVLGHEKFEFVGKEIFIGNSSEGGGFIDIVAKINDIVLLIEVKGTRSKGRAAWGQLKTYLEMYNKFYSKKVKGMIISKGYPFGVHEDIFLLIGYVIENNKIALIPWKV